MRLTIITIAAFAGFALAQGQGGLDLPTCALGCVTAATSGSNIGKCELIDIKCICRNESFLDSIACCLAGVCDKADQEKATSEAAKFCGNAGVTGLPTAVTCKTISSTATTSSATGASAATTTPTSTPNVAIQNMAGVGAGVLGAFAAALL